MCFLLEVWVPKKWNHFFGSVNDKYQWANEEVADDESDDEGDVNDSGALDSVAEESEEIMFRTLVPTFPKWKSLVHEAFVYLYGLSESFKPPARNVYFAIDITKQVTFFIFLSYCLVI